MPLTAAPGVPKSHGEENIALHRGYVLEPSPDYHLTVDGGDAVQLTDGASADLRRARWLWMDRSVVGWNRGPVTITIDLGAVEAIGAVTYGTAAGVAGVEWPSAIHLFVSKDADSFDYLGQLARADGAQGAPRSGTYARAQYRIDVAARGRFARLVVESTGYVFCDEIQVLRGNPAARTASVARTNDTGGFLGMRRTANAVQRRISADVERLQSELAGARRVPPALRRELAREAGELKAYVKRAPALAKGYRPVYPLLPEHARIFALRSIIARSEGYPAVTAWSTSPWDELDPWTKPPRAGDPGVIEVSIMNGEYRSGAFNVTNLSQADLEATVRVVGLPGGDDPPYVTLKDVATIETRELHPAATVLTPSVRAHAGYTVRVPTGMTRQVWLTFHPSELRAGVYTGLAVIRPGIGPELRVPIRLTTNGVHMRPPRVSLAVWDYVDAGGHYGFRGDVLPQSVALMREYFVDSPWATRAVSAWPEATAFDERHRLQATLDFRRFDEWVGLWPGARHYGVYMAAATTFAGYERGTVGFRERIGAWMRAWAAHCASLGVDTTRIELLLVDEPSTDEQDREIEDWAAAIRSSGAGFRIWEDPVIGPGGFAARRSTIRAADVMCLKPETLKGTAGRRVVEELAAQKKPLWVYQCIGSARRLDPYRYYRLLAWHAWAAQAIGIAVWSFADAGGASDSWNEFLGDRPTYTPVFFGSDGVTASKQLEAMREGLEDYELLAMLKDVSSSTKQACTGSSLCEEARRIYEEAAQSVASQYDPGRLRWSSDGDRSAAEVVRLDGFRVLGSLLAQKPEQDTAGGRP